MKRNFAFCLLILSLNCHADWIPIAGFGSDSHALIYVDVEKLERANQVAKIWGKEVFRELQKIEGISYKVKVALHEFNCKKHEFQFLYGALYKDENMQEPIWNGKMKNEWLPVMPNTAIERIETVACEVKTSSPKK